MSNIVLFRDFINSNTGRCLKIHWPIWAWLDSGERITLDFDSIIMPVSKAWNKSDDPIPSFKARFLTPDYSILTIQWKNTFGDPSVFMSVLKGC